MVVIDGGDHRNRRLVGHICRIESTAQADFQKNVIGGVSREGEEGGRGCDLEKRDGLAAIRCLAFLKQFYEIAFLNELARDPDPLMKLHQMRRSIAVHCQSGRLEEGTE